MQGEGPHPAIRNTLLLTAGAQPERLACCWCGQKDESLNGIISSRIFMDSLPKNLWSIVGG